MTFFVSIGHPGIPVFQRTTDTIGQANEMVIVTGVIPEGSKTMSDGDIVCRQDQWIPTTYSDGKVAAYDFISDAVRTLSWNGTIESADLDILREGMRSSIRNARDSETEYSRGVADAMGLIFRTIDCRDRLSADGVDALTDTIRGLRLMEKVGA